MMRFRVVGFRFRRIAVVVGFRDDLGIIARCSTQVKTSPYPKQDAIGLNMNHG